MVAQRISQYKHGVAVEGAKPSFSPFIYLGILTLYLTSILSSKKSKKALHNSPTICFLVHADNNSNILGPLNINKNK